MDGKEVLTKIGCTGMGNRCGQGWELVLCKDGKELLTKMGSGYSQ